MKYNTNINTNTFIRRTKNLRIVSMTAFCLLLLFAFLSIFPIIGHTDSADATYVPSTTALDITSTSAIANVDIVPSSTDGTFATSTSSSEIAFSVTTNNLTGYTLSIKGNNSTGELINTNTADTLETIATTTDADTFATGASATYSNKWGILPSKYNSVANTNYIPAPTDATAISVDATATPNTTANNYTVGLGARVNYEKPSGTYTNTFTLIAVGNPITYQINYLDNSSGTDEAILPMEGANDIETSGFTLSSTVPTKTGYTFNKWCDGTVTHVANGDSICDGTEYDAGANYIFSSVSPTSINTANLYAMWNVASYNVKVNFAGLGVSNVTFAAAGQTTRTVSTSGGTAALVYGVPYTMTMNFINTGHMLSSWALNDTSYGTLSNISTNPTTFTANENSNNAIITATGARLYMQNVTASQCTTTYRTVYDNRDEQTYVMQRLADGKCWMMTNLNLGAINLTKNLTSANTNLSTTVTAATFNSWKKSSGTATYTAAELIPVSGTDAPSGTPYGTLYNYCAASAETICTSSNSSDASYDICPKGWRLPTGGPSSGEFYTLYNNSAYNTVAKLTAPYTSGGVAFTLTGFFSSSGPNQDELGLVGNYWSSVKSGTTTIYNLRLKFDTSGVWSGWNGYRSNGLNVRCVLK